MRWLEKEEMPCDEIFSCFCFDDDQNIVVRTNERTIRTLNVPTHLHLYTLYNTSKYLWSLIIQIGAIKWKIVTTMPECDAVMLEVWKWKCDGEKCANKNFDTHNIDKTRSQTETHTQTHKHFAHHHFSFSIFLGSFFLRLRLVSLNVSMMDGCGLFIYW